MTLGDVTASVGDADEPPAVTAETPDEGRAGAQDASSLLGELQGIRRHLSDLAAEAGRSADHARAREQVILHQRDELDALRAEQRGRHLRPLVVGLQKLRAELHESAAEPASEGRLREVFAYYADSVEAILERCGVTALPVSPGDAFDPSRHVLVRARNCAAHEHRTVLEVLAEGWTELDGNRVLAPAKVVVGRGQNAEDRNEDETEAQENTDV